MQSSTQSIIDAFTRDGVAHLPDPFGVSVINEIRRRIDRYARKIAPGLPRSEMVYEADGKTVRNFWRMDQHDPFFRDFAHKSDFLELLSPLVRGKPELLAVETFNKPARIGSGVPPHQDNAYFCRTPPDVLTVWIAIDAVTEENGPVCYIRGSHWQGTLPHRPSAVQGNSMALAVSFDNSDPFVGKLNAGDALIHHCQVIHYSNRNKSDKPRCGLLMVFRGNHTCNDEALTEEYRLGATAID